MNGELDLTPALNGLVAEAHRNAREHASEIAELCYRSGCPELAAGQIRSGRTLGEVRAMLAERTRADAPAQARSMATIEQAATERYRAMATGSAPDRPDAT